MIVQANTKLASKSAHAYDLKRLQCAFEELDPQSPELSLKRPNDRIKFLSSFRKECFEAFEAGKEVRGSYGWNPCPRVDPA